MKKNDITTSSGNVFADLGFAAPDELRAKADLMSQVAALLHKKKLTQQQAAKLLGVDQSKVSALVNGKLSMFSTERLVGFLMILGRDVEIVVRKSAKARGPGRLQVVAA